MADKITDHRRELRNWSRDREALRTLQWGLEPDTTEQLK